MKTAMQELIQNIIDIESKTYNQEQLHMLNALKISALILLEKEKEQIDKAYSQGIHDKNEGLIKEEYYHETYHPSIKKITITELNTRKQHIIDMMEDDEDLGLYSPI